MACRLPPVSEGRRAPADVRDLPGGCSLGSTQTGEDFRNVSKKFNTTAGSSAGFKQDNTQRLEKNPKSSTHRNPGDATDGYGLLAVFEESGSRGDNVGFMEELLHGKGQQAVNLKEETFGWPLLFFAADRGSPEVVKLLVEKRASATTTCHLGNTVLHVAARAGHVAVARFLIDLGVEIEAQNQNGWTPLMWSVMSGHEDMASCLIEALAQITAVDNDGKTPAMLAARHGKVEALRLLLSYGQDLDKEDDHGLTVLDHARDHQAARQAVLRETTRNRRFVVAAQAGNMKAVCQAIQRGIQVNTRDSNGFSALYYAVINDRLNMVHYLMKHGANPDLMSRSMPPQDWSSHLLLRQDGSSVRSAIKDALGANRQLKHAARSDDWPMVRLALDNGAWVEATDKELRTPIFWACHHGAADEVVHLGEMRAHLEGRDINGYTPLHSAVAGDQPEAVSALYYLGADFSARTSHGTPVVHVATQLENEHMLMVLASANVDLEARCFYGMTPLQSAAVHGHSKAAVMLLALRADSSLCDSKGCNLLHLAVMHDQTAVVMLLLKPSCVASAKDMAKPKSKTKSKLGGKSKGKVAGKLGKMEPKMEPVLEESNADDDVADADTDAGSASASDNDASHKPGNEVSNKAQKKKTQKAPRKTAPTPSLRPPSASSSTSRTTDSSFRSGAASAAGRKSQKNGMKSQPVEVRDPMDLIAKATELEQSLSHQAPYPGLPISAMEEVDQEGRTPLHIAAYFRRERLVLQLMAFKARVEAADGKGHTALMLCAKFGLVTAIEALLGTYGANCSARNCEGLSGADLAKNESVRILLTGHQERTAIALQLQKHASPASKVQKLPKVVEQNDKSKSRGIRIRLEMLPTQTTKELLQEQLTMALLRCGADVHQAATVEVVVNPFTDQPKGVAYVDFTDSLRASRFTVQQITKVLHCPDLRLFEEDALVIS